jgi:hypothetical protein
MTLKERLDSIADTTSERQMIERWLGESVNRRSDDQAAE